MLGSSLASSIHLTILVDDVPSPPNCEKLPSVVITPLIGITAMFPDPSLQQVAAEHYAAEYIASVPPNGVADLLAVEQDPLRVLVTAYDWDWQSGTDQTEFTLDDTFDTGGAE